MASTLSRGVLFAEKNTVPVGRPGISPLSMCGFFHGGKISSTRRREGERAREAKGEKTRAVVVRGIYALACDLSRAAQGEEGR